VVNFANFPITFTPHAALMLADRFEMDLDETKHYVRTAKVVKAIEKDGNIGLLRSCIGDCDIQFVCTTRMYKGRRTLHVITAYPIGEE
jgi:hypothetical protein